MLKREKKAQVTIFILIAILIVAGIIILFTLSRSPKTTLSIDSNDPKTIISTCATDSIKKSIQEMLINGGKISPEKTIMYGGKNYTYLCYNADYYKSCYNIYPMLELSIEEEIRKDTLQEINNCFNLLEDELKDQGFSVSSSNLDYQIDLIPGEVRTKINKKVSFSKDSVSNELSDFSFAVPSSLYDLVKVSRDIINSEAEFCNFEYNGYMLLYPEFDIKRLDVDSSKIYNVANRLTKENFRFAVRSCALPPGI